MFLSYDRYDRTDRKLETEGRIQKVLTRNGYNYEKCTKTHTIINYTLKNIYIYKAIYSLISSFLTMAQYEPKPAGYIT